MSRRRVHVRRSSPSPSARRSSSPARRPPAGSLRISSGRSATSSPTSCAARTRRSCDALDLGGLRVTTTLDVGLQKIAEKWVARGGHRAQRQGSDGGRQGARLQEARAVDGQPQEQGPPQQRARRGRLRDGRTGRLCRQRQLLRDLDQARVPAAVRRRRQGLSPARFGVQAVQLRRRHRRPDDHRGHDADGRRPRTSVAATRRTTPTVSSAALSASATPSSSRSTSRPSRRWPSTAPTTSSPRPRSSGWRSRARRTAELALALGRPGGPPGRPRDGLRDPRQRRQGDPAHDDPGHQGHRAGRMSSTVRAAGRQAGRQPAGRVHRHRHPGRQHEPEGQPVLGQVRDHRAGRPPAGDAQDRHEQRRQGPQRLRLHRPADRCRAQTPAPTPSPSASGTATRTTASCPRHGRRSSRSTSRPTSGRASSTRPPPSGPRRTSSHRPMASSGSRSTRSPGFVATTDKNAVDEWFIVGTEPKDSHSRPDTCGIDVVVGVKVETELRRLDEGATATGSGAPSGPGHCRRARTGRGPRTSTTPVPSVRVVVGRARRRQLRGRRPRRRATSSRPRTRAASSHRSPLPTPVGSAAVALPCPTADPIRGAERGAVGGAVAAADASRHRHPTPTPTATPTPTPTPTPSPTPDADTGPPTRGAARAVTGSSSTSAVCWSDAPVGRSSDRSIGRSAMASDGSSSARTGRARRRCCRRSAWSCGRPRAPSTSSVGRYGRIDSREHRRRIGSAGSAVEASSAPT